MRVVNLWYQQGLDDATRASKQRELQQLQDEVRIAASLNCCNDLDAVILNGLRGDYCFNLVCGKQLEKKGMTEQEKQNAEKYKKVRRRSLLCYVVYITAASRSYS